MRDVARELGAHQVAGRRDLNARAVRGLKGSNPFLARDALTARHCLSTRSDAIASANRVGASAGGRIVALISRSGVDRTNLCQIVPCQSIEVVITSAGANADEVRLSKDVGVDVRTTPTQRDGDQVE